MARYASVEEARLLSKVGKLYYEEGRTQDEIGRKLRLSRAKISRLLHQGRDSGIIKITVLPAPGTHPELETQLERHFRLQEAIIVEVDRPDSKDAVSHDLGIAAGHFLERNLVEGQVIGISWGTTLSSMVSSVHPIAAPNALVVQIIGGLGPPESEVHATDLCRRLALSLGCTPILLPAPGIVDNLATKQALLADGYVRRAFELFARINIAFVGIGAPTPDSVVMRAGSIISPTELGGLLKRGAVGDVALHFFDDYGQHVTSDVDDRLIGIGREELAALDRVVGVAGGPGKVRAIRGALRSGLIDVLITDHVTAAEILEPSTTAKPQRETLGVA